MATITIRDLYDFFFPVYRIGTEWKIGKITKDRGKAQNEVDKMPKHLERHLAQTLGTSARSVRADIEALGVAAFVPKPKV